MTTHMKKLTLLFSLPFFILHLNAQELNCNVNVVSQQVQGTNKQVFETLQKSIYEFINNRNWTNHVYDFDERIECNMMINITEQISADEFKGTLQIQSRRPVYNSSYNTVMFNYIDNDLHFRYVEFETLDFNETTFTSNLTSVLAYYVYIILGLDYDSFSYEGGEEFFRKAENIVNNAQNAPQRGWKAFESKDRSNRYWLINNIMNGEFSPIREFMYRYHRQGLDRMDSKPSEARAEIADAMELLQEVKRKKPDPFMHLLQVVFDAKADEFINVFSESQGEELRRVYTILTEVDPANTAKYEKLVKPE